MWQGRDKRTDSRQGQIFLQKIKYNTYILYLSTERLYYLNNRINGCPHRLKLATRRRPHKMKSNARTSTGSQTRIWDLVFKIVTCSKSPLLLDRDHDRVWGGTVKIISSSSWMEKDPIQEGKNQTEGGNINPPSTYWIDEEVLHHVWYIVYQWWRHPRGMTLIQISNRIILGMPTC